MLQPAMPTKSTKQAKEERLEVRVAREHKEIVRRAAALKCMSLSDFISGALFDAAARTIETHQAITLSLQDSALFFSALKSEKPVTVDVKRRFKRAVEGRSIS